MVPATRRLPDMTHTAVNPMLHSQLLRCVHFSCVDSPNRYFRPELGSKLTSRPSWPMPIHHCSECKGLPDRKSRTAGREGGSAVRPPKFFVDLASEWEV